MTGDQAGVMPAVEARHLAALEQTHPGWRILVAGGAVRWWATRRRPPTLEQIAAGMVTTVARETPERLAGALAVQDEIAHRVR